MGIEHNNIDNTALLERVAHLASLYNSQSEFGRQVGLARQTVSVLLGKVSQNLGYQTLAGIIKGTKCNANWLLFGEGPSFGSQDDELRRKAMSVNLNTIVENAKTGLQPESRDSKLILKAIRDLCDLQLSKFE